MAVVKRRLLGPGGAVFVPNCSEDTIRQHLADGLWSELPEPTPEPVEAKPTRRKFK